MRFLVENECLNKVVAQCFDSTAVMSSGLNGVEAKVIKMDFVYKQSGFLVSKTLLFS